MKNLFNARINFKYLRFILGQYKSLIFVYGILFFAAFPLAIITAYLRPTQSYLLSSPNPEYVPLLLLVFACGVFLISPFIKFNFLFNKKSIDAFHSLPIKRSDLFLTTLFASLISTLVPFIFNYVLGYGLAYSLTNLVYESAHLTLLLQSVVALCAITIIPVFVIMNTGAMSEGIIYTGIACLLPLFGLMAFSYFSSQFLYGYVDSVGEYFKYLSPFVALFRFAQPGVSTTGELSLLCSYWFLGFIFATVFSVCLYISKPSEKTEEPFTNRWFFPIVTSLFTVFLFVSLISLFSYSSDLNVANMIIPAAISFVVFVVLNIIKNRSTKGIVKIFRNFAIIAVATIIIAYTIFFTKGFGFITRVPSLNSIERITVASGLEDLFPLTSPYNSNYQGVVLDSPEAIQNFVDVHKLIVDDYDFSNEYNYTDRTRYLVFTYTLKSGATMKRSYTVESYKFAKLYDKANNSVLAKNTIQAFNPNYTVSELTVLDAFANNSFHFSGDVNKLLDTYASELKDLNYNQYISEGKALKYIIVYQPGSQFILIDERFGNTISYISSNISNATRIEFRNSFIVPQYNVGTRCAYTPFEGMAISGDYYNNCADLDKENGSDEYNLEDYILMPFSYKKVESDAYSIQVYNDVFQINLLIPIIKK